MDPSSSTRYLAASDGLILTALEAPLNRNRCVIAKLGILEVAPDDAVTLSAEITLDGMYHIADNYHPGTELDPLLLD